MTPVPGSNGTGIDFPTIELGGKTYTVKFSRGGLLYRMSKSGSTLTDLWTERKNIGAAIDALHAALYPEYVGTAEQLAELVYGEDKFTQVYDVLAVAIKKVFPSREAAAVAEEKPPAQ